MRYSYKKTKEFEKDRARASLKILGAKDKETKLPKAIVDSHDDMVKLLRDASTSNRAISKRAMNAVDIYDRTYFFDWNKVPKDIQKKVVTPYCFMAPVFAEGQTIPSAHFVLGLASFLKLKGCKSILEIGAGTGYNAAIIAATASKDAKVYTTEIRENLIPFAKRNLEKVGLDNKVEVLKANKTVLGAPKKAPFDRIYSTVSTRKTSQVEQLLDQLAIGGIMILPVAKKGNVESYKDAIEWEPGMSLRKDDIYVKDPSRGFIRQAGYTFKKVSPKKIEYSTTIPLALGPMFS